MSFDLPRITRALLIANVLVFLLQLLLQDASSFALSAPFALWPLGPDINGALADGSTVTAGFRIWQVVTYAFMHGNIMHLFSNMLALFMFGGRIERTLGEKQFLLYYFVCLVVAALCQLAFMYYFEPGQMFPTLGASGAVFGILLAFGMFYPHERLVMIPIPVPIPAWLFVGGYAAVELYLGVTGTQAGVAHFAHLGGLAGGYVLIQYWRGKLPVKPARRLMR
jgi:membrane associated rhomboid family serine protease